MKVSGWPSCFGDWIQYNLIRPSNGGFRSGQKRSSFVRCDKRIEPISDIQADRSMGEPLQAQHRVRPRAAARPLMAMLQLQPT